jgi:hypothetical protein
VRRGVEPEDMDSGVRGPAKQKPGDYEGQRFVLLFASSALLEGAELHDDLYMDWAQLLTECSRVYGEVPLG